MYIEHVAIWCQDLEQMRAFYQRYFALECNAKYTNARGFQSYFLRFASGCRIELMQWEQVNSGHNEVERQFLGLGHIALALGSHDAVDSLTQQLQQDGYTCVSGPRVTGDGYYESCILDPELNRIELCA